VWLNFDSTAVTYSLVSLPKIVCTGGCRRLGSKSSRALQGRGCFLVKHLPETDVFKTNGGLVE